MNIRNEVIVCNLCGARSRIGDAYKTWTWFTGYFRQTFRACGACRQTHRERIESMLEQSRQKPTEKP